MTRRYTYPEAAEALRISEKWLRNHISQLPHSKIGRTVIFTEEDLERIDRIFHREPASAPAYTAPAAHPLAALKPRGARRTAA